MITRGLPSARVPSRPAIAFAVLAACLAVAALALRLRAATPAAQVFATGYSGAVAPEGIRPVDWVLRDENGRRQALRGYRGDVLVEAFMYTACQDTCPLQAEQIRAALDHLGRDVPVLAFSVDPAGDTPTSVRAFEAKHGMLGRMHFLLGSERELAPVWQAYGVRPQTRLAAHSDRVLVIDRAGRERVSFPPDGLTPEGLAHDIRRTESH